MNRLDAEVTQVTSSALERGVPERAIIQTLRLRADEVSVAHLTQLNANEPSVPGEIIKNTKDPAALAAFNKRLTGAINAAMEAGGISYMDMVESLRAQSDALFMLNHQLKLATRGH